jgi:hypothetical protein
MSINRISDGRTNQGNDAGIHSGRLIAERRVDKASNNEKSVG